MGTENRSNSITISKKALYGIALIAIIIIVAVVLIYFRPFSNGNSVRIARFEKVAPNKALRISLRKCSENP